MYHSSMSNPGVEVCLGFRISWIRTNFSEIVLISNTVPQITDSSLFRIVQIGFGLSLRTLVLWARHGGDKEIPPDILPESSPCVQSVAISFRKSATPSSCKALSLALCKGSPLASPKVESGPRLSGLTLRVTILSSRAPSAKGRRIPPAIF